MALDKYVNRNKQTEALQVLANKYPYGVSARGCIPSESNETLYANLGYLMDHGLICYETRYWDGDLLDDRNRLKLHAKGVDFLMGDGGLSARLHAGTVRLEPSSIEALREMIMKLIEAGRGTDVEKSNYRTIVDGIKDFETLKTFAHGVIHTVIGDAY